MNKKHVILIIVIIIISIMNASWLLVIKNEKRLTSNLEVKNEELIDSIEIISTELYNITIEHDELSLVLEDKMKILGNLKDEVSEKESDIVLQQSILNNLEKLSREYHLKLPTEKEFSSMPLYMIEGNLHSMPYSDSKLLSDSDNIGFVLGTFINSVGEEWIYVESFASKNQNSRYGFITLESLGDKLTPQKNDIYEEIDFEGIRFGDDIYSLLENYNHELTLEIEDSYWTLDTEKVLVLIHPENWTVVGLLTRDEDVKILNDIYVGGSAAKAVDILSARYPYFVSEDVVTMNNWFEIEPGGLTISFDYLGSEIGSSTKITEITLLSLKYID